MPPRTISRVRLPALRAIEISLRGAPIVHPRMHQRIQAEPPGQAVEVFKFNRRRHEPGRHSKHTPMDARDHERSSVFIPAR